MADSVKIKITGDDSDYKNKLHSLGSATKNALAGVSAAAATTSAAIAGVTAAVVKVTGAFAEAGDRINDTAPKLGLSRKAYQEWDYVLSQNGSSIDAMNLGMKTLQDTMVEAASGNKTAIAAFKAVGLSAEEVSKMSPEQAFEATVKAFQELPAGAAKSAAAVDMFGRQGMDLLPLLNNTATSVDELKAKAHELGLVMSDEMVDSAGQYADMLDTAKRAASAAGYQITAEFIPSLTGVLEAFTQLASGKAGGMEAFSSAVDVLIADITAKMPGMLEAGTKLLLSFTNGMVKNLPAAVKKLATALPMLLKSAAETAPQMTTALFEIASTLVNDLISMLPELAPVLIMGVVKMLESVAAGSIHVVASVIEGVAGLLVTTMQESYDTLAKNMNRDEIANMSAKINADLDVTEAESAITGAYDSLRVALKTDLLTPEQITEIEGMIGADYDKVYAKLKSFGLSDEDAKPIAESVTAGGKAVMDEIEKLDLSVDSATVMTWMGQANGSRVLLRAQLKKAGLTPEDIESVLGVYEKMGTDLTNGAPNLADEVYKALTDGKADDKEGLKALADTELGKNLKAVEDWLADELAKLNTDSADYPAKMAELTEQAEAYKAEAQALHDEMNTLIESLAGQDSSVVRAKLEEFAGYEERINALTEKLGVVNEQARTAEQRSFNLTRAGATTNTTTIAEGVQFAYQGYKLDVQQIEDEAKKAKEEADAAWEKGLMSDEEHRDKESAIDKDVEAKKAELLEAYKLQFAELMQGIREAFADTNPEEVSTVESVGKKSVALGMINQFLDDAAQDKVTPEQRAQMATLLEGLYKELLGQDVKVDPEMMGLDMMTIGAELTKGITEGLQSLEGKDNPLLTALEGIFSSEAVAPLEIDTSTVEGKMRAAMGDVAQSGVEGILDKVDAAAIAGGAVAGAAATKADVKDEMKKSGINSGLGWIAGWESKQDQMKTAAYNSGKAVHDAFARGQKEGSPSKLFIQSGRYSGQGYEIGLKESMTSAMKTARVLATDMAGAVNLPSRMVFAGGGASSSVVNSLAGMFDNAHLHFSDRLDVQSFAQELLGVWNNQIRAVGG